MLDWWLAPIDPSRAHEVASAVAWHARVMTLAWGILVPVGILSARFFKLWPGQRWPKELDHPGWWHLHRICQYGAGLLTLLGLALILGRSGKAGQMSVHIQMGWLVIGLAAGQFASAWLRGSKGGPTAPAQDGSWRGDHYDMTPRRVAFEYVHKFGGYVVSLIASATIITGLWHANAPRWMWLIISTWWLICLIGFVRLQQRGHAVDTYQAHWGTDEVHPGNRRPPIGFGIRRLPAPRDQAQP